MADRPTAIVRRQCEQTRLAARKDDPSCSHVTQDFSEKLGSSLRQDRSDVTAEIKSPPTFDFNRLSLESAHFDVRRTELLQSPTRKGELLSPRTKRRPTGSGSIRATTSLQDFQADATPDKPSFCSRQLQDPEHVRAPGAEKRVYIPKSLSLALNHMDSRPINIWGTSDSGRPKKFHKSTPHLTHDDDDDDDDDAAAAERKAPFQAHATHGLDQKQRGILEVPPSNVRYPGLLLQPDSRPISQEQLNAEVQGIYAGLTMVETKCIQVDKAQASVLQETGQPKKLANDHWQALIALHRTLLHEHHDFFLASQHPSTSLALQRLASKYSMPARMWKHGIHSFLELLRRRLPESLDYMLAFIYLSYQMMALLYETVPAFEDTWIECLGDLGRYRMAIEDEDLSDRETWAAVARSWYSKAADKNPHVGRLYHHLAILARPNALQQLYYYSRSLACVQPFKGSRESILTLLEPILAQSKTYCNCPAIDLDFVSSHAVLFQRRPTKEFDAHSQKFLGQLDGHIGRITTRWKEQGVYIAVANIAALFDYGAPDSRLFRIYQEQYNKSRTSSVSLEGSSDPRASSQISSTHPDASPGSPLEFQPTLASSLSLAFDTLSLVLRRVGDKNILPHIHCLLVFLYSLTRLQDVETITKKAPWSEIASFLTTLRESEGWEGPLDTFGPFTARGAETDARPLPEDYLIRGQIWSAQYWPNHWFDKIQDEEERSLELASTVKARAERILWLGLQIVSSCGWLKYDHGSRSWTAAAKSLYP